MQQVEKENSQDVKPKQVNVDFPSPLAVRQVWRSLGHLCMYLIFLKKKKRALLRIKEADENLQLKMAISGAVRAQKDV